MDASELQSLLEDAAGLPGESVRMEPARLAGLARRALSLGHPLLACEWLLTHRALCEQHPELRYLMALSEARIGSYRDASRWLSPLLDTDLDAGLRVDVLSLAGRIAKDCWRRLPDGPARQRALVDAVSSYQRSWEESLDPFPGINAASLLLLSGDRSAAESLAGQIRDRIEATPDAMSGHWREATLGEAALLLGDEAAAQDHYRAARKAAGARLGDLAAMRRQLSLLATVLPAAADVRELLGMPTVLTFTGHMVDPIDAVRQRFPAYLERAVSDAIKQQLETLGAGIGYCSAACGGDLLFIEAMLERGAEVHVFLPFSREDFVSTSVAVGGDAWVSRFDAAMARVSRLEYGVAERYLGDDALFHHASTLAQGAARLRARELESEPLLLAVLDAGGDSGPGGTLDTVTAWEATGLQVRRIDLSALRQASGPVSTIPSANSSRKSAQHAPKKATLHREVRTMLFADVVGYSRLAEEHTPSYLLEFLARVAGLVEQLNPQPEFVNTWGDGLFMVFRDVAQGAHFALALRDMVVATDWPAHGLPDGIALRIGMHVGPVYPAQDPLLHRANVFGTHVTRAARIEPVAAAGSVFVSEESAYALAAEGNPTLRADYLGSLPLAKGFGDQLLYRLTRYDEVQ